MPGAGRASVELGVEKLATTTCALTRLGAEELTRRGIDPAPLLARAAIAPSNIQSGNDRISARQQSLFLNLAADALGDDLLGFHLAQKYDCRALGLLYYVTATAATLARGLASWVQHAATVDDAVRLRDGRTGDLSLELSYEGFGRHLDCHQAEFWLTGTLRQCRILTRSDLIPAAVSLVHVRSPTEMEGFFGREIAFGAQRDLIASVSNKAKKRNRMTTSSVSPIRVGTLRLGSTRS
jgi:hypothetical protein